MPLSRCRRVRHRSIRSLRPVNVVITPQRIIYTQNKFACPKAINWNDIDNETMLNLPVLKEFKRLQQLQHEM